MRVRETCKTNEVQLDPGSLGLQGPPGQSGERGPALVWKDASGMFVGMADFGGGSAGVRRLGGNLVRLDLNPSGFIQRGTSIFGTFDTYYVTPDCSGTPLFPVNFGTTDQYVFSSAIFGTVMYHVQGPATVPSSTSQLVPNPNFAPFCSGYSGTIIPGGCCRPYFNTFQTGLAPVVTFDLTTLGLVPPFHIEGP